MAASDPRHVLWRMGAVGDAPWVRRRFRCSARAPFAERMTMIEAFAGHSAYDQLSMLSFHASASMSQRVWSKLGEAAGKVVYYPFAARSVMEAAFEAPWEVKLREPKGLLRDAARKAGVPEFVISRPKANFNATPAQWSAPGAALEPLVPLAAKAFDEKEIRRRQTADWADAHQFATMLNYAIWKRLFIHGDRPDALLEELERSSRDAPAVA